MGRPLTEVRGHLPPMSKENQRKRNVYIAGISDQLIFSAATIQKAKVVGLFRVLRGFRAAWWAQSATAILVA